MLFLMQLEFQKPLNSNKYLIMNYLLKPEGI
jgi:hypothetical protein